MTTENKTTEFSEPFTFVQMNFWEGRLFYPIDKFLKREQADILSTQEMLTGDFDASPVMWTANTLVSKGHFDKAVLGLSMPAFTRFGCNYDSQCVTFIKNNSKCVFENRVLLYQGPTSFFLEMEGADNYYSLLHMKIVLNDGSFVHILNHHGRLIIDDNGKMGSPIADYNFRKIAEYISTLDGPVILSGDFNILKEATSLKFLKDIGLVNLNETYNITAGRNEFAWSTEDHVSYIFVNDQVQIEEYRFAMDNVSDHFPIILRCRVKR